ncbi:hypothetical protein [Mesobacillus campisalis]|nr:hypothetical protein [Mesobacillus campisalis]
MTMRKEDEKALNRFTSTDDDHSMVCHEGLFYEGLRAAIDDMEQDDPEEK